MRNRHRQTDRLFAAFCRSGDPAALGAVFDRTAAELLHVAVWLCGNRADAEDLLQRTFVQAIELRAQFEPGRPVLPWLCGMLANLARHLRRERARALPRVEVEAPREPIDAAGDAELAAAVRERVAALQAPYRELLELHLQQGLNAKQIGERLGRPAGTVRTQLVRALELLRRRLPRGFVAGTAALCVPDAARLIAVREAVMTVAKVVAPATAGAAAATGGLLMGKKLIAACAVLVLLGGSAAALWPRAEAGASATAPLAAVRAEADAADEPPASSAAQRLEVAIADAPKAPAAPAAPAAGSLQVRVHWGDGSVAAEMPVFVSFATVDAPLLQRRQATTDVSGRCAFESLRPGRWWLQPLCGEAVAAEVAADAEHEVALTAEAKAVLHGVVVDAHGAPIPAEIWTTGPDRNRDCCLALRTAADGTFALPVSRALFVGARQRGHAPSPTVFFFPQSKRESATLRLGEGGAALRGTVRDAAGTPVAGARVLIGSGSPGVRSGWNPDSESEPRGIDLVTDADGSFAAEDLPIGSTRVQAWSDGFAAAGTFARLAAGQTAQVELVLSPGSTARGIVFDIDGRPVAGACIECGNDYQFDRVTAQSGADGSYVLSGLPTQTAELTASDAAGSRVSKRLFFHGKREVVWNPRLQRVGAVTGRVVDAACQPLPNLRVACGTGRQGETVEGATDPEGQFALAGLAPGPQMLSIWHGDTLVRWINDVVPGSPEIVVQLSADEIPSARLRLRTVDADRRPVGGCVQVQSQDGRPLPGDENRAGVFQLGPLLPGTLEIGLRCGEPGSDWLWPLTTVTVAAGEERDLGEFFVPPPGRLRICAVGEDGAPRQQPYCTLHTTTGQQVARFDDGQGAAPAGRWLLCVRTRDDFQGSAMIDVQSGCRIERDVRVQRGTGVTYSLQFVDQVQSGMSRILVRDADGMLVGIETVHLPQTNGRTVKWLPPGCYAVEAIGPGRLRGTQTLTIERGSIASTVIPMR